MLKRNQTEKNTPFVVGDVCGGGGRGGGSGPDIVKMESDVSGGMKKEDSLRSAAHLVTQREMGREIEYVGESHVWRRRGQ